MNKNFSPEPLHIPADDPREVPPGNEPEEVKKPTSKNDEGDDENKISGDLNRGGWSTQI